MEEKPKCIYIADDDDNIRQVVRTFLVSDGYLVEDFPTGDLLLERFRQSPCDLVILDVMMPGSDGFTICTELRKISTVPIIMLTARDAENDYAMGLGLGSDDYITKPFSAMALLMRVRAIFRRETRATDDTVRRLRHKLDGCGVSIEAVWGFGFRLEETL